MEQCESCYPRAHLETTTVRAAEATERPTPDRAAARTKRLVPPDQESGAPVVVSRYARPPPEWD